MLKILIIAFGNVGQIPLKKISEYTYDLFSDLRRSESYIFPSSSARDFEELEDFFNARVSYSADNALQASTYHYLVAYKCLIFKLVFDNNICRAIYFLLIIPYHLSFLPFL